MCMMLCWNGVWDMVCVCVDDVCGNVGEMVCVDDVCGLSVETL